MRGVRQIVRLNWPLYAVAAGIVGVAELGASGLRLNAGVRTALHVVTVLACAWTIASLAASWIVYDRSRLTRWEWIRETLARRPHTWLNLHSGFDESTPTVRRLLAPSTGRVFDIFDPVEMSEPSIRAGTAIVSACSPAGAGRLPQFAGGG
jgi:hypothetical protein